MYFKNINQEIFCHFCGMVIEEFFLDRIFQCDCGAYYCMSPKFDDIKIKNIIRNLMKVDENLMPHTYYKTFIAKHFWVEYKVKEYKKNIIIFIKCVGEPDRKSSRKPFLDVVNIQSRN